MQAWEQPLWEHVKEAMAGVRGGGRRSTDISNINNNNIYISNINNNNIDISNIGTTQQAMAPIAALRGLQQLLQEINPSEYFNKVIESFREYIHYLRQHGFPTNNNNKVEIGGGGVVFFFACPQGDGSVLELFPNGASVPITAENYKCFLKLILNLERNIPSQLRELPLDPKFHLSGNYLPLTSLIVDYLANLNSDWCIDNEEDWNFLNITYCVPFNGQLYDIYPGTRNDLVPFNNAKRFGKDARKILKQLINSSQISNKSIPYLIKQKEKEEEFTEWEFMTSHGYVDFLNFLEKVNTPLGKNLSLEEFNKLNLTYSIPFNNDFIPLLPGKENEYVEFKDKDLFVKLAKSKLKEYMTSKKIPNSHNSLPLNNNESNENSLLEQNFWKAIEDIRENLENYSGICFVIKVLNCDIILKENGASIAVTEDNVDEYINLVHKQREIIHAAFIESEFKNSGRSIQSNNLQLYSNSKKLESLTKYPPQNSHQWNNFTLEIDDYNNENFNILQNIPQNKDKITSKDYNEPFIISSFSIPIKGKGLYKLLPHGETIPVTSLNKDEFIERIEYEKKRLELLKKSLELLPGDWVLPLKKYDKLNNRPKNNNQTNNENNLIEILNGATLVTLDEIDMYEKHLLKLKKDKNRISVKVFEDIALRYIVKIGEKEIELVEGGCQLFVSVQELDHYVNMAISKLNEIRHCIFTQNQVNSKNDINIME